MRDDDNLSPPKRTGTIDPGAHDLAESEDSEDHFSDAQSAPVSPSLSPIPRTRVEKISDEPSYGEVPGTEAYRLREGDAEPDEIAIISDEPAKSAIPALSLAVPGTAPSSSSQARDSSKSPPTPGGFPIPKTVLEEAPGPEHHHSAEFEQKRKLDAEPDVILKSPIDGEDGEGAAGKAAIAGTASTSTTSGASNSDAPLPSPSPISPALKSPTLGRARRSSSRSVNAPPSAGLRSPGIGAFPAAAEEDDDDEAGDDDFGDDFDDFEEGGGDDAEFDDFEDDFQQPEPATAPAPPPPPVVAQPAALPFPIPDFDGYDADEVTSVVDPYLNTLFPPDDFADLPELPPLPRENPQFLTQRSASLWSQLVAPPPLAPPDWIRSRIRRLFLVSLGVPVDLDEILPASKQKKLVLPSLHLSPGATGSPRASTEAGRSQLAKLKHGEANASSTSLDSQGRPSSSSKRRKGPPPEPTLDLVSAKQLCMTTDAALDGMTDAELQLHVAALEALEGAAKEALEYWQKRTDEKIADRETYEGVISNLVKHAQRKRKT